MSLWSRLPRSAELSAQVFTSRHRVMRVVLAAQTGVLLMVLIGQRWFSAGGHHHTDALLWGSYVVSGMCLLADGLVQAPKVRAMLISLGVSQGTAETGNRLTGF